LLLAFCDFTVTAQSPTDEEVKAIYIYNLINFVEWPASTFKSSSDPFIIGVSGGDSYLNILRELVKGESYRNRPIEVRKVDPDDVINKCHILYIEKRCPITDRFISLTKDKSILTVGDHDDFLKSGGMVRFFLDESKVKIEINKELAQQRNLVISAKLLRLAKLYME
jgi:hypothetical protein